MRQRQFMDCRDCGKLDRHTGKAGCILAVQAAQAANEEAIVSRDVLDNGLDLTDVIAQAEETEAQRTHYEVKRTSPASNPRTGPGHTYTYRPKLGDVVIFPNGVEFNYSEHDEQVVAVAPRGKGLTSRYTADEGYLLLIGVE